MKLRQLFACQLEQLGVGILAVGDLAGLFEGLGSLLVIAVELDEFVEAAPLLGELDQAEMVGCHLRFSHLAPKLCVASGELFQAKHKVFAQQSGSHIRTPMEQEGPVS